MAEPQILVPAVDSAPGHETQVDAGAYSPDAGIPHAEHEDAGLQEPANSSIAGNEAVAESGAGVEGANGTTHLPEDDTSADPVLLGASSNNVGAKGKPTTLSVKPAAGKSNSGPPTPLVKKVCKSYDEVVLAHTA
jgi:hypothetical protein